MHSNLKAMIECFNMLKVQELNVHKIEGLVAHVRLVYVPHERARLNVFIHLSEWCLIGIKVGRNITVWFNVYNLGYLALLLIRTWAY